MSLCLIKHYARKMNGGVELWLHSFLTSTLYRFRLLMSFTLWPLYLGTRWISRSGFGEKDKFWEELIAHFP
jgi:hypothetical protein